MIRIGALATILTFAACSASEEENASASQLDASPTPVTAPGALEGRLARWLASRSLSPHGEPAISGPFAALHARSERDSSEFFLVLQFTDSVGARELRNERMFGYSDRSTPSWVSLGPETDPALLLRYTDYVESQPSSVVYVVRAGELTRIFREITAPGCEAARVFDTDGDGRGELVAYKESAVPKEVCEHPCFEFLSSAPGAIFAWPTVMDWDGSGWTTRDTLPSPLREQVAAGLSRALALIEGGAEPMCGGADGETHEKLTEWRRRASGSPE